MVGSRYLGWNFSTKCCQNSHSSPSVFTLAKTSSRIIDENWPKIMYIYILCHYVDIYIYVCVYVYIYICMYIYIYRLVPSPGTTYDGVGGMGWDVNVHVKLQMMMMMMMMMTMFILMLMMMMMTTLMKLVNSATKSLHGIHNVYMCIYIYIYMIWWYDMLCYATIWYDMIWYDMYISVYI